MLYPRRMDRFLPGLLKASGRKEALASAVTREPRGASSPSCRFVDSSASVLLDLLRGCAALIVFLEHWRNVFFVDYGEISSHRGLWAALYAVCGAGHQAVVVFFVLSGYFIGGTVDRAMGRGEWRWNSYLLRRVVRLWMVLLPALIACLFWDKLGIHLGLAPQVYKGVNINHILPDDVSQLLSLKIFLGNLFFLQGLRVHTYGSDGALWSLANEFWYYILFPLALCALHPSTKTIWRFVNAALLLLVAWQVGAGVLLGFPIWLMGALLVRMPQLPLRANSARRARLLAAIPYSLVFFYLAKSQRITGTLSDYVLGALTFFFLWLLLTATKPHSHHSFGVQASRGIARFSYTLYTVHTPVVIFLGSLLVHDLRWQPTLLHVVLALVVLVAVIGYAFGLAWLTEFRTDAAYVLFARVLGIGMTRSVLPHRPTAEGV